MIQKISQAANKFVDFGKTLGASFANWAGLAKIAQGLGGGAATLVGGPILGLVMQFVNSTKAKFIKKFVIDNYLNFLKLTAGPFGVVAIDILSAYLHQVARNYDQGLGWKSLKTNITNWFPTDKMLQWLPQQVGQKANQISQFFTQKGKQQGGFWKYFSGVKTKKVLSNGQFQVLKNSDESLDQFIVQKQKLMDQLYEQNLSLTSYKSWQNWWNGKQKSKQEVQRIGNAYVNEYVDNKKNKVNVKHSQKLNQQKNQQQGWFGGTMKKIKIF